MRDAPCPECGTEALWGSLEDVLPDAWYSRTPITPEAAQRLTEARTVVMAARRTTSAGIVTQFWHELLGPEWTILIRHDCEEWK